MKSIATTFIIVTIMLSLPASHADAQSFATPASASANPSGSGSVTASSVSFAHKDCVGPGVGLLPPGHVTHTQNVTGFVISSQPVRFTTTTLALFGAGPCPTGVDGPVLPQDFTGRYHFTAICRGVQNVGAVFIDVTYDALAGIITGVSGTSGSCIGTLGQTFSIDLTVEMAPYVLNGISIPPTGGVMIGITQ